jgi:hypothetical protein
MMALKPHLRCRTALCWYEDGEEKFVKWPLETKDGLHQSSYWSLARYRNHRSPSTSHRSNQAPGPFVVFGLVVLMKVYIS